jgi:hypothetical protein
MQSAGSAIASVALTEAVCERRRGLRGYHFDFADDLIQGPTADGVHA